VGVTDPTALHYNPGALARLDGTRFLWHQNLVFHDTTFHRAPLSDGWGGDAGTTFAPTEDGESLFPLGGFVALSSDLGQDGWVFAAGVYGPSAVGKHDYPAYGPQSFMLTEMDVVVVYYSLAFSRRWDDTFGVGFTLQWVDVPNMEYELVVNGTSSTKPQQFQPVTEDSGTLLLTRMKLQDRMAISGIAGVWWRPVRWLETGLAWRLAPVALRATGGVETDKPTLITDDLTAEMAYSLPPTARGGVRYVHEEGGRELFDVELDVFWEGWSVVREYDIELEGEISGQEVQDLTVQKAWQDSISVRLGGGVQVIEDILEVNAGGYWERGAAPDAYTHLDFPSFDRLGLGLGLTWTLGAFSLSAAWLHVFQEDRTVTESHGKQLQQRPLHPCPDECEGYSGVVANAGTFESSYDLVSLGVEVDVDALLDRQ